MADSPSLLLSLNRVCAQLADALHQSEIQIYATIALIVALSVLLFPPRDDPDQI